MFTRLVANYPEMSDLHGKLGVALEQLATNLRRGGETDDAAVRFYEAAVAFAHAYTKTDEPNQRAIAWPGGRSSY